MYIITIDSGTTNSRIRLVHKEQNSVIDVIKKAVGVRNTAIDGKNDVLHQKIAEGLDEIITRNQCKPDDIQYIIATGMITSNLGLYEIPHVESPAMIDDFAKSSSIQIFSEFHSIPCIFVPGMKNRVIESDEKIIDTIDRYDVMRGEEVETFGLIKQLGLKGKGMVLLPGSHSKCVFVTENKLESCLSTLCGEMIQAISQNTILSNSIGNELITEIEPNYLIKGFEASKNFGLTRTLYQVRLLHLFGEMSENQRANYFVGALIASDFQAMQHKERVEELQWIVVGGSNLLRRAFVEILDYVKVANVIEAKDEQVELSTVIGAIEVGELVLKNQHKNVTTHEVNE